MKKKKQSPTFCMRTVRTKYDSSACASLATEVEPGFFSSWRKANLRSFISQRLHRIDTRSAANREPAGQQRNHRHDHACSGKHRQGQSWHVEQDAAHRSPSQQRPDDAQGRAGHEQAQAKREELVADLLRPGAECHTHANLAATLRDGI